MPRLGANTNTPVLNGVPAPLPISQSNITQIAANPASFMLQNGLAVCQTPAFTAVIANDISSPGAINVMISSGQRLKATVYGLAYMDFVSGRSVLLARLTSSTGQLTSPTKVLFRNCFDSGISADVQVEVSAKSVDQSIVLRKRIPGPESFNLPGTSRLAVLTSIDAPEPVLVSRTIDLRQLNEQLGVEGEDTMQDSSLIFGSMRLAPGTAWSLDGVEDQIPVAKNLCSFPGLSGRYLIESTPYMLLQPRLNTLPTASVSPRKIYHNIELAMKENPPSSAVVSNVQPVEVAQAGDAANCGLALDWTLVTSAILNVDFGAGTEKIGLAAIGQSTNDLWNWCNTAYHDPFYLTNLVWSDATICRAALQVNNGADLWGNETGDPMYDSYIYPSSGGDITVRLSSMPAGTYDIYIYGHGPSDNGNGIYQLSVNSTNYDQKGTTIWGSGWNTTNWEEGQQYVVYRNVIVAQGDTVSVDVETNTVGLAIINGMQIVASDAISHGPPPVLQVLSLDFGGSAQKTGIAAVGLNTNDTWNWYDGTYAGLTSGSISGLFENGVGSTGAGVLVTNGPGYWGFTTGDPMYDSYIYPWDWGHLGVVFTNLYSEGLTADFYVYGHGPASNANTVFQLTAGTNTFGPRGTTIWGSAWATNLWEEGVQYVVFRNVPISMNQPVFIDAAPGLSGYTIINGLQIAIPLDRDGDGVPDWMDANPNDPSIGALTITIDNPLNGSSSN